jgi:mycofactocin precursor
MAAVNSPNPAHSTESGDETVESDDHLVEEDLLVEEISIDGMCGVY